MIESLIGPVTGLLDKFVEDKDQKAKLAHEVATMAQRHAQELAKAQLEVNKVEAAHKSLFVSGWRPAVGWCCVLGMTGNFMVIPFTNFVHGISQVKVEIIRTLCYTRIVINAFKKVCLILFREDICQNGPYIGMLTEILFIRRISIHFSGSIPIIFI